jgi:hypothetical protein
MLVNVLYKSNPTSRLYLLLLAPAPAVVLIVFFSTFGVKSFLEWENGQSNAISLPQLHSQASALHSANVALLVFDEIPLTSIMTVDGGLDAERFPNIASLAEEGIWFRNASTVSDFTRFALPSIASGRYPFPAAEPTPNDYPLTVFSLLENTHRIVASEPLTRLCRDAICGGDVPVRLARQRAMWTDMAIVGMHILLPPALRSRLPTLNAGWAHFGAQGTTQSLPLWHRLWRGAAQRDPWTEIETFMARVEQPPDRRPTFYFMHSIVSHNPYHHLPTGQRIKSRRVPDAISAEGFHGNRTWAIRQRYQKHLLTVAMVDGLVGRFVDRLKRAGIYEDTLIIITSDHGVSFRPATPVRILTTENAPDVVPVPFIMKPAVRMSLPRGVISDVNIQTIDIVPTIAGALGLTIPWEIDGLSALDGRAERSNEKRVYWDGAEQQRVFSAGEMARLRDAAVARKAEMVGTERFPLPLPSGTESLIGRPVEGLTLFGESKFQAVVEDVSQFAEVDITSREIPAQIVGTLTPEQLAATQQVPVVIAINGRVVAITQTWEQSPNWLAVFSPSALRPGYNDVQLFTLDVLSGRLHRLFRNNPLPVVTNASRSSNQ